MEITVIVRVILAIAFLAADDLSPGTAVKVIIYDNGMLHSHIPVKIPQE